MKLCCLDLQTTDAAWNLAAEQYVFDSLPRDRGYLMLWQNRCAVIVGKYQNTQAEINAAYVREHGIQVVRRLSGGGAVYHDLGNLNYTLITDADPSGRVDLAGFCRPVVEALRSLGVPAELNGRNDICVEGRKCSGNAQYVRQGRVMHHGTLLFDSDLEAVAHALRPEAEKLRGKGVESVRSRVANLRPYLDPSFDLAAFRHRLMKDLCRDMSGEPLSFSPDDLQEIERIKTLRYDRWDWNFGRSPAGTMEKKRRIENCGTITLRYSLDAGRLSALSFSGDFFSENDPELLAERLVGRRFCEDEIAAALKDLSPARCISGLTERDLMDLLFF